MKNGTLNILQVSSWEREGGAERVAVNLHHAFRAAGHDAWLAVGGRSGSEPDADPIDPHSFRIPRREGRGIWPHICWAAERALNPTGRRELPVLAKVANRLAEPMRMLDRAAGREEFRFPGSARLLELAPSRPDILHCHNLHGGYFDLRRLSDFSRVLPTVLTLHDPWLMTGHCAYPFECDRWQRGCGTCPHLDTYPSISRDGTAANWRRKQRIYASSRLHIAAPCKWMLDMVERSMLAAGVVASRIIPYGVDLDIFHPVDPVRRASIRASLDIPPAARVLLYAANRLTNNPFKDLSTLGRAVEHAGELLANAQTDGTPPAPVVFLALGGQGETRRQGIVQTRFIPFQTDPRAVAGYYQAADLFLHAAKADHFPNTVLESLACGTPVVATGVGGIPEQIRSLVNLPGVVTAAGRITEGGATGVVVPPGDADSMGRAVFYLLSDVTLVQQLADRAGEDARSRFDLRRQAVQYIEWFEEIRQCGHSATK